METGRSGDRDRPAVDRSSRATSGSVAVEFALLTPVVLALMAGLIDLCEVLAVQRKVVEIAYTVSDLVAQEETISTTDVNAILAGASAIIRPYDAGNLVITVAAITPGSSADTVTWALALNATAPSAGSTSTVTIPSAIKESGVEIIAAEVTYTFYPVFSDLFGSAIHFDRRHLSRPRKSDSVALE